MSEFPIIDCRAQRRDRRRAAGTFVDRRPARSRGAGLPTGTIGAACTGTRAQLHGRVLQGAGCAGASMRLVTRVRGSGPG